MIGALLLGVVAGVIARAILPDDVLEDTRGPMSWLASILLGLIGSLWGWLFLTAGVGIGGIAMFDWGGVLSGLIGVLAVVLILGFVIMRADGKHHAAST